MRKGQLEALETLRKIFKSKQETARLKLLGVQDKQKNLHRAVSNIQPFSFKDRCTENSMEIIGADVAWQAWSGRQRSRLNRELALLKVEEEVVRLRLKKEFGKSLACDRLIHIEKKKRRTRPV